MLAAEWIITGLVAIAFIAGFFVIRYLRKDGRAIPGRMCAGCPNACGVLGKPPVCAPNSPAESDTPT